MEFRSLLITCGRLLNSAKSAGRFFRATGADVYVLNPQDVDTYLLMRDRVVQAILAYSRRISETGLCAAAVLHVLSAGRGIVRGVAACFD